MWRGLYRIVLGVALLIAFVNLGTGCGAMFNQDAAVIPIRVNPPGARVFVDGQLVGEAPVNVSMPSTSTHTVDVEADGYERHTGKIEARVGGGYIALDCVLLLFGIIPGVIALVVDGTSGDWKSLEKEDLSITLIPVRAAPAGTWPTHAPPFVPPGNQTHR